MLLKHLRTGGNEMIKMAQLEDIRKMYFMEELSIREISRRTGIHRDTNLKRGNTRGRFSCAYAVCGQAEKCIKWTRDEKLLADRLSKRESDRTGKNRPSRFEVGDNKALFTLKNKLKLYSVEYNVFIVQPGVDSNAITSPMHQVLCSASAYLMDTCGISLHLICS
jgi:hypothetical protein